MEGTHINKVYSFSNDVKMSKFQNIDIKPVLGRDWILNGDNNDNFKIIEDAYDDSPTNQSIINAFVNYIYGEGIINKSKLSILDINQYISKEDIKLICYDFKTYGGYSIQIIWDSNDENKKPLKIKYIPISKLGVNYNTDTLEIDGYWYCWDWTKRFTYRPEMHPKFTGVYKGNDLEILVVKRPSSKTFFPVPDYISGIPWAQVEGELANAGINHYRNYVSDITVVNYNGGSVIDEEERRIQADKVRDTVTGSDNESKVFVSFNESIEDALVIDRVSPPDANQQNIFYSEEAERKLIVAHSAPPILFSGSNTGNGFSSNADEIEVATNALYRRHINPIREMIIDGLHSVFKIIDMTIEIDFKDFRQEELEDVESKI